MSTKKYSPDEASRRTAQYTRAHPSPYKDGPSVVLDSSRQFFPLSQRAEQTNASYTGSIGPLCPCDIAIHKKKWALMNSSKPTVVLPKMAQQTVASKKSKEKSNKETCIARPPKVRAVIIFNQRETKPSPLLMETTHGGLYWGNMLC